MAADKFRECPFCGSTNVRYEAHTDDEPRTSVNCGFCGAQGPAALCCDDARELWNDREPEHDTPQQMGWVGQDGLP